MRWFVDWIFTEENKRKHLAEERRTGNEWKKRAAKKCSQEQHPEIENNGNQKE
jgi:hypothetical protein